MGEGFRDSCDVRLASRFDDLPDGGGVLPESVDDLRLLTLVPALRCHLDGANERDPTKSRIGVGDPDRLLILPRSANEGNCILSMKFGVCPRTSSPQLR